MRLFDEKYVHIEYDDANEILIQTWLGFISSENFRKAIDKTVEFSKTKPVKAIISDTSQLAIVRREDTEYAASIMPALIEKGLRKMAFVLSDNTFAQMSVKNFESQTKGKLQNNQLVKHFVDLQEAKDWIIS